MKKRLINLLILLFCVVLSACSADLPPESSQTQDSSETASDNTDASGDAAPNLSHLEDIGSQTLILPEMDATTEHTPVMLADPTFTVTELILDQYYGNLSVYDSAQGILSIPCFSNLQTREKTVLSYPVGFPNWTVASGSYLVMQKRYLYEWKSYSTAFGEDTLQDVKLTRVDAQTGKVEVVDEAKQNSPFVYLCKIDDTRFLSYTVLQEAAENAAYATVTTAWIYDINGEKTKIIHEVYENDAAWQDSKGILIEKFAVREGEIYGFGRQRIAGEYRFFLYHYDCDGNLIETAELPGFAMVIGKEQPVEMHFVGDYLACKTYESLTSYVCKITDGRVDVIMKGADGRAQYAVSDDTIYMMQSNVDVDSGAILPIEQILYVIDASADSIHTVRLKLPCENPYFVGLQALSNGDVILSYCENGIYDPLQIRQFLILESSLQG